MPVKEAMGFGSKYEIISAGHMAFLYQCFIKSYHFLLRLHLVAIFKHKLNHFGLALRICMIWKVSFYIFANCTYINAVLT